MKFSLLLCTILRASLTPVSHDVTSSRCIAVGQYEGLTDSLAIHSARIFPRRRFFTKFLLLIGPRDSPCQSGLHTVTLALVTVSTGQFGTRADSGTSQPHSTPLALPTLAHWGLRNCTASQTEGWAHQPPEHTDSAARMGNRWEPRANYALQIE